MRMYTLKFEVFFIRYILHNGSLELYIMHL